MKNRIVCKDCENKKKKNNLIQNEITASQKHSKLDKINDNNGTLLVGPSSSGKTYLMLKIFFPKTT